jgi:hypothetical protein
VEEAGKRLAVCAPGGGSGKPDQDPWSGRWSGLDYRPDGGAVWPASTVSGGFLSCRRLPGAAGEGIAGNEKEAWIEEKKIWLKDNRWPEVLDSLRPFLEEPSVGDAEAPVRACFRYISNHSNFLDYKGALAAGLPIGSGEIESAHRYIMQRRLKISGAWWKVENLGKMLALRVVRAKRAWEDYWSTTQQEAA